ncbi:phosphopantetheine-binding protein, partial [Janthinobacterium sp. SUN120]|uniref:phosphopantetheine-binding protein n=1 Tax=Janthinobacterium sp. SUN120 TaxID=3004099 RepID=UPI0025B1CC17
QVRDAVVLAREDQPGDQRLVGYVVRNDIDIDSAALQLALQASLPAYMVPSVWVTLDTLPLNPNGKVDRKALPAPDASLSQAGYVAPLTDTEETLVAIWSGLLNLKADQISTTADFFALGGHSLLAIRLVSEVADKFGIQLQIRKLFEQTSIVQIATLIDDITEMNLINQHFESMSGEGFNEVEI